MIVSEPPEIIIHVVDVAGQPVMDAFVTVEWGTAPTPEITQLTNAAGHVRLMLPPGQFRIRAAAKGHGDQTTEVDTTRASGEIEIQLGRK